MSDPLNSLTGYLSLVDQAAAFTPTVKDFTVVKAARKVVPKLQAMANDATHLRNLDPSQQADDLAAAYAAGDITATQLAAQAAHIEAARSSTLAISIIDTAMAEVAGPHLVALRKLGDQWIDALRPEAERRLAGLDRLAQGLPAAPFHLDDLDAQDRHNLELIVARWDEIIDLAEKLLGATHGGRYEPSGRVQRWLRPDAYTGTERTTAGYGHGMVIAYHRAGAMAGLWTRNDQREAAPAPTAPTLPPAA